MARLRGRVDRLQRIERRRFDGGCPVCRGHGRPNVLIHGSGDKPVGCAACGKYRCTWLVSVLDEKGELIGPSPRGAA